MAPSLTLDELIAFNDELAALVRGGVPLDVGLADLGSDLPSGLGRINRMLAERLEQGESLPIALAAAGDQFPPLYRALVSAGIKSGRLPAALEQIAQTARRMAELQRLIVLSLVYPLMVVLLCYGLLLFFATRIAPVLYIAAPLAPRESPPAVVQWISQLDKTLPWWGAILPTVAIAMFAAWWLQSRRAMILHVGIARRIFVWAPALRRLLADSQVAGFAETLALLVEHETPLAEAVTLAANATGDRALIHAAAELSATIISGGQPSDSKHHPEFGNTPGAPSTKAPPDSAIPPLLRWLIVTSPAQPALATILRQTANNYRRRAIARTDWLRWRLPLVLTVGIGGTATLIYSLLLFVPWVAILKQLSRQ